MSPENGQHCIEHANLTISLPFPLKYDETKIISHTDHFRNSANIVTSVFASRRPRSQWTLNMLYIRNLPLL